MAETRISTNELRRLAESDIPALAFPFSRTAKDWAPPHSHERGQLFALTEGLLMVDAAGGRWLFPSRRCAWIPPGCVHAARSVRGAAGFMLYLSAPMSRGLPGEPRVLGSSGLLFAIVDRIHGWGFDVQVDPARKRLLSVLRDEIRRPPEDRLRLPMPGPVKLARVARSLLDNIADDRTLDQWAREAGMARRTFMRAFSREVNMPFGQWRRQARLFAAMELLAQNESVTDVALAVGYDSVSAFIEMFRALLGATPLEYFRRRKRRRA